MYSLSANGSLSYGVPNVNNAMQRALSDSALTQSLFKKPLVEVAKIIGSKSIITAKPEERIITGFPQPSSVAILPSAAPTLVALPQPETRYGETTTPKKWYQKPAVMIGLGAGTLLVLYLATKKK